MTEPSLRLRVWAANKLVRLANKIRPKQVTELMKSVEHAIKYGYGAGK